ncbi:hypothetical protein D9757_008033 [Collybiopsis confluens]|uniref:BRO1 domain-containing protein n=1 Tax=Collybiopsis confluens TaxID=2823264 RepID=A0A8H5M1H9_9AGAR|nr:hypothetical protein D9757_008033 [Collybiopsis confluens]
MSNLLPVPFKKTYSADVASAARIYLLEHGETHPDAVKTDIKQWQQLRSKIVDLKVHANSISDILRYHAQLTSIITKLPVDVQLEISYAPVFSPSGLPISLNNLIFERAALLFNLGALFSQLAASEDRSNIDGIKRAAANFQCASGTFQYLRTIVLPTFLFPPSEEDCPIDLSSPFIHVLEYLTLAQAQECFWQKAKIDNRTNGLVSKLAAGTMDLYGKALTAALEATPAVKHMFPSDWLAHIEAKRCHFEAVAYYRKSREEVENSRYGPEIAYLTLARSAIQKGYDVARKAKIFAALLNDIQAEMAKKETARAERDNDLIYHHDMPPTSSLPVIQPLIVAQPATPKELSNPHLLVATNEMLFSSLMGWGTREAINIYNDRKKNLIEEDLVNPAKESRQLAERTLQSLSLPASLDALERHIGLPPSLLKKAEEVRLEDGPAKIEAAIEDLYRLSRQNSKLLNEAMDILDHEASEDESARGSMLLDRAPSHEANAHVVEKERRYRAILNQAAASDETIRVKWDQWDRNITELTWDEADLEASVPSSTKQARSSETEARARELRTFLESLDEIQEDRENLIRRARALADVDDIQPRILKAAAGLERLAEAQPAMFEDVSNDELAKYDKFVQYMKNLDTKQQDILNSIEAKRKCPLLAIEKGF